MNLETRYLGFKLKHPIVPSASPLTYDLAGIRRLEDAGAPCVVVHSLFEEQIEQESRALDHYLSYGTESFAEALDYFPEAQDYNVGPEGYLDLIRNAKSSVDIPVIGSLNGSSPGGWTHYAKLIEEAGADALELNIYHIPTDQSVSGSQVEELYLNVVRNVRQAVKIPLAVKVSPFFSSTAHMALQFERSGADGLVLFNRFYQPDFDLETLDVVPHLVLSDSHELRLPLRWVAILYGRIPVDFAITSGIHSHLDVLKGLMAGASVTMMASELLAHGLGRIHDVLAQMTDWLEEHEYESVEQLTGSMSQISVENPESFERANYMKVLQSWRPDPTGSLG
ncbi:MAG: dihydroorotate dehydrogenase-like protein [Trueperaceae bacterium]|nr:MAG: dihydroorotate dehydrogenase-like protein [Trueperaceae bacterium]